MKLYEKIAIKVEAGDVNSVKALVNQAVQNNHSADEILTKGLIGGMMSIGVKFKNNTVFIPEVLIAARAMKTGLSILSPLLANQKAAAKGKIVIGTVKGDLHDIGKNIVCIMLEGAGYEVVDLGIDVSIDKFIQVLRDEKPDILCMSALLTTTKGEMKAVIDAIASSKLDKEVKILVGGAPVTKEFAERINADGYAEDAAVAVDIVNQLILEAS